MSFILKSVVEEKASDFSDRYNFAPKLNSDPAPFPQVSTFHFFSGNSNRSGKLRTFDPLIKVACFVKKVNNVCNIKISRSKLVHGGQLYRAFPLH
jgi:hypothetical protein